LVDHIGFRHARGELADEFGGVYRDVDDPRLVEAKHDSALQGRSRIVEVHDGAPGPADRVETALD